MRQTMELERLLSIWVICVYAPAAKGKLYWTELKRQGGLFSTLLP